MTLDELRGKCAMVADDRAATHRTWSDKGDVSATIRFREAEEIALRVRSIPLPPEKDTTELVEAVRRSLEIFRAIAPRSDAISTCRDALANWERK
jgi:hypothetical protein